MSAASRIESLERRVKADPASAVFASLAEEYRRAGRLGEAVETARSGLERHPAYASARVTLARALHELGELDEAREEFEAVLGFAPENLAAIRGLAEICRATGDAAGTLEYLNRALALAPLDVELRSAIAEAEAQMVTSELASLPSAAEPAPAPPKPPEPAPPADAEIPAARSVDSVPTTGWPWGASEEKADEPVGEPFASEFAPADLPPFAQAGPSEAESAEDARTSDSQDQDRPDPLRRQEAALERFLAEILKERDRRAS